MEQEAKQRAETVAQRKKCTVSIDKTRDRGNDLNPAVRGPISPSDGSKAQGEWTVDAGKPLL